MPTSALRRTVCLAAVAAGAAAAAPAAASAATVYAAPGGLQTGTCATPATACGLYRAVETVPGAGDTVVIGSGKYSVASTLTLSKPNLTLVGAAGPRPLIEFASTLENQDAVDASGAANLRASHLAVAAKGAAVNAFRTDTGTFDSLDIQAPTDGSIGFFTAGGATITNSTFVAGSDGVWNNGPQAELRNVSIWSAGQGFYSSYGGGFKPVNRVHNSIVHGDEADFSLQSNNSAATLVTLNVDHSSYRPDKIARSNTFATFNDQGGNVSAAPLLTNPAAGDFHQLAGSPTIDRGSHEAADGATDVDGAARVQGAASDIGADEFDVAPARAITTTGAKAPADPAPALASLKLSPTSFEVAAKKRGARKSAAGTTIAYRDSEAATTRFTVQRRTVVRRRGHRKVRWTKVRGSFGHTDHAGRNTVRFSGRIGGRALKPGAYRLVAVARDSRGQKSAVRRAGFRITG